MRYQDNPTLARVNDRVDRVMAAFRAKEAPIDVANLLHGQPAADVSKAIHELICQFGPRRVFPVISALIDMDDEDRIFGGEGAA